MSLLPPNFITHDDLPEPLRALRPRYVEKLARAGKLGPIRPLRLTPCGGVFYLGTDVAQFLAEKLALEGGAE